MQYVVSSPRHRPGGIPYPTDGSNPVTTENGNVSFADEDNDKARTYTVEDAIESIGLGWFQFKIFIVGKVIAAADAMEMMMLAVLSPLVRCEWQLEDYQVAFITTSAMAVIAGQSFGFTLASVFIPPLSFCQAVFLGMGIASPLLGIIGDKYGRRVVLFMVTICIAYFGFLTSFSPTYGWMLFLRGLVGVGMGGSPQGFSLNAEYIPSKYRAKLLIFGTVFWTLGAIIEIGLAMVVVPPLGWRWLLGLSAIPVTLACVGLLAVPESARFLTAAGYMDDAHDILVKAAKINKSKLPEGKLVKSPDLPLGRARDLFSREYLRSTLQLWVLWFGVAFTYYGMVLASAEVLRVRNEEETSHCKCAYLSTEDYVTMLLSSLGELLSLPINFFLIDRIGRKKSGALCYFGSAIFFVLIQLKVNLQVLTLLMFFVRAFASATFNFVYIYSSELYPTSVRTLGMGIASAWARVGAMLTPFVAQVLLSHSVSTATWVYGVLCTICGVVCLLLPIETRGRALPQFLESDLNRDHVEMSESDTQSPDSELEDRRPPARISTVSQPDGSLFGETES